MAAADVIKETTAFTASTRDDIGEKAQTLTLREDAEGHLVACHLYQDKEKNK